MSDLKQTIFKNILDKKFTKANNEMAKLMKDKVFATIDQFKKNVKYNPDTTAIEPATLDKKEPNPDV